MTRGSLDKKDRDALSIYLSGLSNLSTLNEKQEKELIFKIAKERFLYWMETLSYPPLTAAIVDQVREELAEDNRSDELAECISDSLKSASREYRNRQTKVHLKSYDDCRKSLAIELSKIDLDGDYISSIVSDIKKIYEGDRSFKIKASAPPKGSRKFHEYIDRIDGAAQRLARSKEAFIKANLRLVVSIARRYFGSMPVMDLIQEGNIGLIKAVDRFDGSLGYRFSTYGTWWIRHSIGRAIVNKSRAVRIPAGVSADLQKVRRVRRELEAHSGRGVTDRALAEGVGVSIGRLKMLQKVYDGHVSIEWLDDEFGAGSWVNSSVADDDSESHDVGESLELLEEVQNLHESLKCLIPIEIDILEGRYEINGGDFATLRELGERHSLSRERIRQLQDRAIDKLRREMRKSGHL